MTLPKTLILILMGAGVFFCAPAVAQENREAYRLTLQKALEKAGAMNLQVMMANARLEEAIARISQARSDLLPHLEGTVSGARQTADLRSQGLQIPIPGFSSQVGPFNNFDARPRLTMALFDAAAFERFQAARKGADLSKAQLEKMREDTLALVASLYLDAQRKDQTLKLYQSLLERDQMAYELSQQRFNQGTGTQLDSNKISSDLSQTKFLVAQARLQAEDARLDLVAALQLPLKRPLVLVDDNSFLTLLESKAAGYFEGIPNADVKAAASQLEARNADEKEASAGLLPSVSGAANYGRSGATPARGSNTYFVGVQASVPIWEGGSQQARIKEAKGNVKEAHENLVDAQQQQEVNTEKARQEILEAFGLKEAKSQQRQTAQKSLLIALHAQQIGSGSAFQVMQAKADLALAEDALNEANATWILSHIDLLHAQGRLRELVQKEGDR